MNRSGRSTIRVLLAVAVVALVVGAGWFARSSRFGHSGSSDAGSGRSPTNLPAEPQLGSQDTELRPLTPEELAQAPKPPAVVQPVNRPATNTPAAARPEPTREMRQRVAALTQTLDPNQAEITKEQAEHWKKSLQDLTEQGAAVVPAIREFLEKNYEVNFKGLKGSEGLGESSLRTAFINALRQIDGPEAQQAMVDVLRSSLVPGEIALLAQHLEEEAPGQYRQEVLSAARESLTAASKGELKDWDVGPAFRVLQTYGDTSTVSALENAQAQWRYYATMAMAGFKDEQGIPILVQQVKDTSNSSASRRDFAYQMLAQVGGASPQATAALIEQASQNAIPESAWRKIGEGLAGEQYQMGNMSSDGNAISPGGVGLKSYQIASGNQKFYSVPLTSMTTEEEVARRRALISQIEAVTTSPAGVEVLQKARAALAELGP